MHQKLQQLISQTKWRLYRGFDMLGQLGRIALVFCLMIILLMVLFLLPLKQKIHQRQVYLQNTKTHEMPVNQPVLDQKERLRHFIEEFPDLKQRELQVNQVVALAQQNSILLKQVTYKNKAHGIDLNRHFDQSMTPSNSAKHHRLASDFVQTFMEFNVNEPYLQVHQFLNAILVELPTVAIDTLSFSRLNTDQEAIDARVRLTFYFRRP